MAIHIKESLKLRESIWLGKEHFVKKKFEWIITHYKTKYCQQYFVGICYSLYLIHSVPFRFGTITYIYSVYFSLDQSINLKYQAGLLFLSIDTILWLSQALIEVARANKTQPWEMKHLDKVLKIFTRINPEIPWIFAMSCLDQK